jgi:tungstate transport system ATP-binding protein
MMRAVDGHEPPHTGTPVILSACDVRVVRGAATLVAVDRFELPERTTHVLLGPNGAGKSTFLRVLNGLERASGSLWFDGREVTSGRDRLALRRATAAVFQRSHLLATSVRANVESGLRARGVRGDQVHSRAQRAMELVGVEHLAERGRDKLSGGEAQRVSVARALAVEPKVLFLDEPMASLDPPTRRSLLADLGAVISRLSIAVVWVTHDRDEAVAVADGVTFLSGGQVSQTGPAEDIFLRPATAEIAQFLGLESYIEGEVVVDDGAVRLVLSDGTSVYCADAEPGPGVGCLFPEDVVLFRRPPEAGSTSLRNRREGNVKAIEAVGRLRRVTVASGTLTLVATVTQAAVEELALDLGTPVVAAFKASAVHVLPRPVRRLP